MKDAGALAGIYEFLTTSVGGPLAFEDLLRAKVVYSVSAFDKLIHDLVRIGMVEIFVGQRLATLKYQNEPISLSVFQQLKTTITPPAEVVFEEIVRTKLKTLTFQDPDKIADGLSYIWPESQKWHKIATAIGMDDKTARTTLKLIVARRNSIVHEADMDPVTHERLPITKDVADNVADFLLRVGEAIGALV
jgi:hypothetical protein